MTEHATPSTEIEVDANPGSEIKERSCLMCHEHFLSEWSGERICKRCRQTAVWRRG